MHHKTHHDNDNVLLHWPTLNNQVHCENDCGDIYDAVQKIINLEDHKFLSNDIFIQLDSGIEVNSITYQQFISYAELISIKPLVTSESSPKFFDAAFSCERDRDYDCEAWGDYNGAYKSYIVALQNQVYNYEWSHTLTQSDIDAVNTATILQYDFTVGVITFSPAARFISVVGKGLSVSTNDIIGLLVASGVSNVIVNQMFTGPAKTKLRVGDVIVVKKGKVVSIVRNGITYSPSQITGVGSNTGSGGSSGDTGSTYPGGGGIRIPWERGGSHCYRTFSNGQVIFVPCP